MKSLNGLLNLHKIAVSTKDTRDTAQADGSDARQRFIVAFDEHEAAKAALTEAVANAEWGPQADGSFVTRQSTGIASGRCVHTLHAPGRQGPLVEVQDAESWGSAPYLRVLRTREEALLIRQAEREKRRTAEEFQARLRAEVDVAVDEGRWVWFEPGQQYGIIRLTTVSAPVSARGVCKRAGVDVSALPERAGWIRFGLPPETPRRVSLRAMPARVRRLPAGQRAQAAKA